MASTKESNTSCFDSSNHEVIIVDSFESINVPTISAKDSYHSSVNSRNKKSNRKKKNPPLALETAFKKAPIIEATAEVLVFLALKRVTQVASIVAILSCMMKVEVKLL